MAAHALHAVQGQSQACLAGSCWQGFCNEVQVRGLSRSGELCNEWLQAARG